MFFLFQNHPLIALKRFKILAPVDDDSPCFYSVYCRPFKLLIAGYSNITYKVLVSGLKDRDLIDVHMRV